MSKSHELKSNRPWTRKEIAAVIVTAQAIAFIAGVEVGFILRHIGMVHQDSQTLTIDNSHLVPVDTLSPLPSPTRITSSPKITTNPTVTPSKEPNKLPYNPFRVGPFNFETAGQQNPLFVFITLPDGKKIESHASPKAQYPPYNQSVPFDQWWEPTDSSYLDGSLLVQICHSSTVFGFRELPCEPLRQAFEANGRPLTTAELSKTIDEFKRAQVSILQGGLSAKTSINQVDSSGKNLTNPIRQGASIKGVIRYGPQEVAALEKAYSLESTTGQPVNLLMPQFSHQNISIDPQTDFAFIFCGREVLTLPNGTHEARTPGVHTYLTSRYLIIFSLAK